MSEEEDLPPHVKYWLSPDSKHNCYFIVGPESGPNERIGAFKDFLVGYSEPFRNMLQDSELAEQGDISLVDIQPGTFTKFLKCLYTGCDNTIITKFSFQESVDLLYVVEKYLVTHVKETLVEHLLRLLPSSKDYVFIALSSPVFLQEHRLEKTLAKTVQSKVKIICLSTLFMDITDEGLLWLLKLDTLETDEISLWEAVLKWATHKTNSNDGNVLRNCILKHLKFIRFCAMNHVDFCKNVIPTDILTHTEVYEICKSSGTMKAPIMEFICNDTNPRQSGKVQYGDDPFEISFSHCVNDISNFDEMKQSERFKFQNYDWYIQVEKNGGNFGFFLSCESLERDSSCECSVTGELILINHKGVNLVREYENTFCNDISSWGFDKVCSWNELLSPSKRYVMYNSITVMVHLKTT